MSDASNFDNIMIDLETLGIEADCAILSIGAVRFNAEVIDQNHFYRVVSIESNLAENRTISPSTLRWWLNQTDRARAVFSDPSQISLAAALNDLERWIGADRPCIKVWGNGSDFDNAILAHAYRRQGGAPWEFYNSRCFRTIKSTPSARLIAKPDHPDAHNALQDAINQAQHLQAIWRAAQ